MKNFKERIKRIVITIALRVILRAIGWQKIKLSDGSPGWLKVVASGTEYKGDWRYAIITSLEKINFFRE